MYIPAWCDKGNLKDCSYKTCYEQERSFPWASCFFPLKLVRMSTETAEIFAATSLIYPQGRDVVAHINTYLVSTDVSEWFLLHHLFVVNVSSFSCQTDHLHGDLKCFPFLFLQPFVHSSVRQHSLCMFSVFFPSLCASSPYGRTHRYTHSFLV